MQCMHLKGRYGWECLKCSEVAVHLQRSTEALVGQPDGAQLRGGLALAQPGAALPLRVHQDGEARGARDQDAVLYAQVVRWQALPRAGTRLRGHSRRKRVASPKLRTCWTQESIIVNKTAKGKVVQTTRECVTGHITDVNTRKNH